MSAAVWPRLAAATMVLAALVGVGSATSLGPFDRVVFGSGKATPVPCTSGAPTYYTGVLGSLIELDIGDLRLASDVTYIGLDPADTGDCVGTRPLVVLTGDNLLTGQEEVLSRTMLAPLSGTDPVLLEVDPASEINTLLNLDTQPTAERVAFCPPGFTSCEVGP